MTPKPDTKINKIKTVEEIGRSFAKDIGFMPMEQAFNIALTQDRQQLQKAREGAIREERTQQMIKQREGDFGYEVMFAYLAKDKDKAEADAMKVKMNKAFKALTPPYTPYNQRDHRHCPDTNSPCGHEGAHRCCICNGTTEAKPEFVLPSQIPEIRVQVIEEHGSYSFPINCPRWLLWVLHKLEI